MSGNIVFRVFPSIAIRYGLTVVAFNLLDHAMHILGLPATQLLLVPAPILKRLINAWEVAEVVMATMIKEEVRRLHGHRRTCAACAGVAWELGTVEVGFSETGLSSKTSFREFRLSELGVCGCVGADVRTLYLMGLP
jgi:hypothetical protein